MLINFSYLIKESVLLWKVAMRAADFHSHPSRPILNQRNLTPRGTWGCWASESWAAGTTGCGARRRLQYAYISCFLDLVNITQGYIVLHQLRSWPCILEKKKECFGKRERQTYEGPGDGKLARYQSSPCLSGAVFKYCCALCHCLTKAIMLSSLRRYQRQRAPTSYCTTTAASMQACCSYA